MTRITVRLTPRGGRDAVDGWDGDVLRLRVAPPATDGQANDALVRLLAKKLRIPRSRIAIVSGAQSRVKVVEADGLTAEDIRTAIG